MEYEKPSQQEMMQARYADYARPNYTEPPKFPNHETDMVSEGSGQPYYMFHKDRYNEYR